MNVLPPQKLKCDQARQAGSLPRCLLGRQLLSWWFYPDAKSGFWICRLSLKLVCQLISGATSLRQLLINPAEKDQKVNLLIYYINYKYHAVAAAAKSLQSCPTLWDPIDGSPPGSPVPGILQARTLEWVAISFSNAWKWKVKSESEVAQSCPTLHDPMDCSLPGSSVRGIFQARVLEWGAIAFSAKAV